MKVLVTGATGYLGSHLVKALLDNGHKVIILKRSTSDTKRIIEVLPRIASYDVDRCELSLPFEEHGPIDAIIHTATSYGKKGEPDSEIFEANTAFPLRLLETASLFNTNTFFNTDTFFNMEPIRYNYLVCYTLSKKQFLEWGKLFANAAKIHFVNIRLEHIYGPDDNDSKFTAFIIKSCLQNVPELKLTAGEQKRDFIYIDDVTSAYEVLLENTMRTMQFQEYSLGRGVAIPIREFVEVVHRISGAETQLNFGALPYRDNEIMFSKANTEGLRSLGWRSQVNLTEGIKKILSLEKKCLL